MKNSILFLLLIIFVISFSIALQIYKDDWRKERIMKKEEKMAKNKDFLWVLIFIAFLIILHISFKEGMEREERRECMQWKKWASEIRRDLFYPSEEMINQCKQYGILIERR